MIELEEPVNFNNFDPSYIPFQDRVIDDIYTKFDFSKGYYTVFNSGSIGSAKTLLGAHVAVRHCLENRRARCLLGRRSLQDLRDTVFTDIVEHIEDSTVKSKIKSIVWNSPKIEFTNGSEIICRTWGDKKPKKVRSLKLSMALIEELTENENPEDEQVINEIVGRLGRLPHVRQNILFINTNPDEPDHWAYERFIAKNIERGGVYYSLTKDNPFLPDWYVDNLMEEYDPLMIRRMLYGEWISIISQNVYYMYKKENNYRDFSYEINPRLPIHLSWDFNIGDGKPLSMVLFQYHPSDRTFHFFDEVVVEGMRTRQSCEEIDNKGYFSGKYRFVINGDRNGKNKDTRNNKSDYDIIEKYLSNHKNNLMFTKQVPSRNPEVRKRHNTVNGLLENAKGEHRLFVYKGCEFAEKALRLTKLKKNAGIVEDDSKGQPHQHIGTAMGYGIMSTLSEVGATPQGTRQL